MLFTTGVAQTEIKVMSYNLMLYQSTLGSCNFANNDPDVKEANLNKIVKYIDPDLILFQEIGSQSNNIIDLRDDALNTNGVSKYQFTTFASNASLVNHAFYNTEKLGYVGHDAIEKGVSNQNLVRLIDVYTFYYLDPQLAAGADTTYLTAFVAHLKAGQGSSNENERAVATESVMDYVANNNLTNYLLAGDLNVYSSNEEAYQNLTNSSNTSDNFIDPTGIDGDWHNSAAGNIELVHTQSTHTASHPCFSGGGMDDRFDFILINDQLETNADFLEYDAFSYRVIGNDGNRFNSNLLTPTNASVPLDIAEALYNLSDHLPVVITLNATDRTPNNVIEVTQTKSVKVVNPIQDFTLRTQNSLNSSVQADLIDLSGKLVETITIPSGRNRVEIKSSCKPGIYFLRFHGTPITPIKLVII